MNSRRLTHDRIHPSLVIKIPALNRDLMAMLHRKFDSQAKTALGQGLTSVPGLTLRNFCPHHPRFLPSFRGEMALTLCANFCREHVAAGSVQRPTSSVQASKVGMVKPDMPL
jgi:hypothetical protein